METSSKIACLFFLLLLLKLTFLKAHFLSLFYSYLFHLNIFILIALSLGFEALFSFLKALKNFSNTYHGVTPYDKEIQNLIRFVPRMYKKHWVEKEENCMQHCRLTFIHFTMLALPFKLPFFDSLIFLFYLLLFMSRIYIQLIKFWTAKELFTALAQIFWMCRQSWDVNRVKANVWCE